MTTLRDLVCPVSPSVEAVLISYGQKEAFQATVLSRKGESTGHSVYLVALEVKSVTGTEKLLLEVPELKDPSNTQKSPFNHIQVFRDFKPGTNIALVVYKDDTSTVGYNGSIRALVPLPASKDTIAYSARRDIDNYLRAMFDSKYLQNLEC